MSLKTRGRINVSIMVTVSMFFLSGLGYAAIWIISNFQTVYADNAQTNADVAGLSQHISDIDMNVTTINDNLANLESAQGQILDLIKNRN